jgi:excisionase family DNA binding protein
MRLLTPETVAEQLSVSRSTVLRMIQDGALPAVCLRSGRRKKVWRVREEVLQRWVLSKEKQVRTNPQLTSNAAPEATGIKPSNGEAPD